MAWKEKQPVELGEKEETEAERDLVKEVRVWETEGTKWGDSESQNTQEAAGRA